MRVTRLLGALDTVGSTATATQVYDAIRRVVPGIRPAQLDNLIDQAIALGAVERLSDGRIRRPNVRDSQRSSGSVQAVPVMPTHRRAVAVDLECVVRTRSEAPYLERAIREIGVVRFGTDPAWNVQSPSLHVEVTFPARFDRRSSPGAIALAEALDRLEAICDGADVVVTYNGTDLDWPVLVEAFEACGREMLDIAHADVLPLAHALWPLAVDHRLQTVCAIAGVAPRNWHRADEDATATADLVLAAGARIAGFGNDLREILLATTRLSPSWRLAADLAGLADGSMYDGDQIAVVLDNEIVRPEVRAPGPTLPPSGPFRIPAGWRDATGHVDAHALASVVRPGASRRAGQDEMQDRLRSTARRNINLAVEAPTGSGKSLALLAAAFDWLAQDPEHLVVISTHTKQLQAQLARDLESLAQTYPALRDEASVAKGSSNRLSLRALTVALAEATRPRSRRSKSRAASFAYEELLAFLALRFIETPVTLLNDWEIRSADTADIPPCFELISNGRWKSWLADLSQAAASDLDVDETLGGHTRSTSEHLSSVRLIVANHALVFAHLDHLVADGDRTLLLADEAHTLESAGTDAFSAGLDAPAVEVVISRAAYIAGILGEPFTSIAEGLEELLDSGVLHRTAMDAMDALVGPTPPGAGDHPRSSVIASAFSGGRGRGVVRSLVVEVGRLARRLEGSRKRTAGFVAAQRSSLSPSQRAQVFDLLARLTGLAEAAKRVVGDIDAIWGTDHLGTPPPRAGRGSGRAPAPTTGDLLEADAQIDVTGKAVLALPTGDHAAHADDEAGPSDDLDADTDGDLDDAGLDDTVDIADFDDRADDTSGIPADADADPADGDPTAAPVLPAHSNRVIYINELNGSDLSNGARGYRFAITTAPVRLPADHDWADFAGGFARLVLTSATLTVAGDWRFLEDRLGVAPPSWERHVVTGGFDWATQAKLYVFDDFPSWVEQPEGAIRTAAHQLAGYATALDGHSDPAGLVLTTSTAAASAIAERVQVDLGASGNATHVWAAPIFGNRLALERHMTNGGLLIGTKGLWAGIDIDQPERVRLVWINKLPFPPFADPLISTRRAEVTARAEAAGHSDPEAFANEEYYLPLAALDLRQGVGRLVRSTAHHGVVLISDRRLAGSSAIRRTWRRILLGSLAPGLNVPDPVTGEDWNGNVMSMTAAWTGIWTHLAACNHVNPVKLPQLTDPTVLEEHVWCPETLAIRQSALDDAAATQLRANGTYSSEVATRAELVAQNLKYSPTLTLDPMQREAIVAAANGADVLGLLATGFGKSFCYQLPALIEPGVTVVVSPLVALMADQALDLNKVAGGAVRALVAPMRESVSRAGRQDLADQLEGRADHGIKLVYMSPERLAHRTMRDWLKAGVAAGRVRRLVFDEAHTLIQWGEDFRPSYRRLAAHVNELHAAHPNGRLPISAFTATANRTVREGLINTLFNGLPVTTPATSSPGSVVHLVGEPIRPELAIYRRSMSRGGQVSLARLVESLVDAATDHTIIYATTIRNVDATWNHLRAYVGEAQAARVRRFHGRLPEAEKADVLAAFKQAPTRAEAASAGEPFAPLIIVATSAFGLGVDRADVRCVVSMTPPTDLAALYQQLGRAGRDARGSIPANPADANVAIAIGTRQGFRTVEFLTRDLPQRVFDAAGRAVLRCGGVLDASTIGERILDDDVANGLIDLAQAAKDATRDQYQAAVVRALASLVDEHCVEDLGDFPSLARLRPGSLPPEDDLDAAIAAAAATGTVTIDVTDLHGRLAGVHQVASDPAGFWSQLIDAHHRGVIDASCATGRWRTSVVVHASKLPANWTQRVGARAARAARELTELRSWYADSANCANVGFANYFAPSGAGTVPHTCCSTDANRCSTCQALGGGRTPNLFDALIHPRPRRSGPAIDDLRLDTALAVLLRDNASGLGVGLIRKVLRGEDTYWDTRAERRRPLRSRLLRHRLFGTFPGIRDASIIESLQRLEIAKIASLHPTNDKLWIHTRHAALMARTAATSTRTLTSSATGTA